MKAVSREEFADLTKGVKPRIRRELRFVPEEITDWEDRDFLAVTNKSRTEGVLLVPGETPRVVPFQLQNRRAGPSGRVEAVICDICATWQRGSNSAVITFTREKSSVSFLCCADLLCSLHVRDKTDASKLSRVQLRENNTAQTRALRLRRKLSEILGHL